MEEEGLDFRAYGRVVQKWWWVFALGMIGAALAAFLLNRNPVPIYEASTKVLVEGRQTPGTPSASDIQTSRQLAGYYGSLIKTRPILEKVSERLPYPYSVAALSSKIDVVSPGTFIEIRARDPDPVLAAAIANVSAETFIEDLQDRQFAQIAQFQASLSQYGIGQDPSIIAAQVATMRTLSILETATPPRSPSNPPRQWRNMILGALMGLFVAGIAVFALEFVDDRVRSPDELKRLTGLTPLGSLPHQKGRNGSGPITIDDPHQRTALAESYKFLRTNLEFAALEIPDMRSILVTSSSPSEGKTTTAANLAISVAREGKTVFLLDCDLRKPALHHVFGLESHTGLTNILLGEAELEDGLATTVIRGLHVITTGPRPPDPTPVLRSPKMRGLIERLCTMADLIILDSPPVLAVTDPMLLSPLVDGVILVVDAQHTGRQAVKRAAETIKQASPPLLATVLNKVRPTGRSGYDYYYYYYYASDNGTENGSKGRLGRLKKILPGGRARRRSSSRRTSSNGTGNGSQGKLARLRKILPVGNGREKSATAQTPSATSSD